MFQTFQKISEQKQVLLYILTKQEASWKGKRQKHTRATREIHDEVKIFNVSIKSDSSSSPVLNQSLFNLHYINEQARLVS